MHAKLQNRECVSEVTSDLVIGYIQNDELEELRLVSPANQKITYCRGGIKRGAVRSDGIKAGGSLYKLPELWSESGELKNQSFLANTGKTAI